MRPGKASVDFAAVAVMAPGATVELGIGADTFQATVTCVQIYSVNYTRYLVVWWDGRCRKEEWLEAHEVRPAGKSSPLAVGFVNNR